ncbi:lipoyl(octanoyl) transferase LipB [Buchnera aphidicola (Mollitrichosiphum nigrofasciatum)]|uniref:lipoyl(octanoyl) transferase LipB n=1 Tax=Buchnera aphidicola TaxID=9 RepID=UPI0031B7F896
MSCIIVRDFGLIDWKVVFLEMHSFTVQRTMFSIDEIWFVEHYPIFTFGQRLNSKQINVKTNIPCVYTNRGGEITYHGPGQQIIYLLINIKLYNLNPRKLISIIENCVIKTLNYFSIVAYNKLFFPGVYVNNKKICSIGLRIINGFTLHGLSINVKMNLSPFNLITPCGDKYMKMTQISDFCSKTSFIQLKKKFLYNFVKILKIKKIIYKDIKKFKFFK